MNSSNSAASPHGSAPNLPAAGASAAAAALPKLATPAWPPTSSSPARPAATASSPAISAAGLATDLDLTTTPPSATWGPMSPLAAAVASSPMAISPDGTLAGVRATPLPYAIHDVSSAQPPYHAHHIQYSRPHDEASRWTSRSTDQAQYLTVVLPAPSIVTSLVFGKFHKPHVCNLQEFRVFAGMSPDTLTEVFHGGLENTSETETIAVKHRVASTPGSAIADSMTPAAFPVQFIKIVPHAAYQRDFPFSIWYLEVHGIADPQIVAQCTREYAHWRDLLALRACLAFTRRRPHLHAAHAALLASAPPGLAVDAPIVAHLFDALVRRADYVQAEQILDEAAARGILGEAIAESPWRPQWRKIVPAGGASPGARAGHQAVLDSLGNAIYLFGGWDGAQDLGDFWRFDLSSETWTCLARDVRAHRGPSPRSCHRAVMDVGRRCMYVLGRYVENGVPAEPDFWRWDVESGRWTCLSGDTAAEGGPATVYDHQMVLDESEQVVYVFGGRVCGVLSPADGGGARTTEYSGLFKYAIRNGTWEQIQLASTPGSTDVKPRTGHAMTFHARARQLLVLGGQRGREAYGHFLAIDVDKHTAAKLPTCAAPAGTAANQRAVLDDESNALLVLSHVVPQPATGGSAAASAVAQHAAAAAAAHAAAGGPTASSGSPVSPTSATSSSTATRRAHVQSAASTAAARAARAARPALWTYRVATGEWTRTPISPSATDGEPPARFAHTLTVHTRARTAYLFGGNPNDRTSPQTRLGDMWALDMHAPSLDAVVRAVTFHVRRARLVEMARRGDVGAALEYLREKVTPVAPSAAEVSELAAGVFLAMGGMEQGDSEDGGWTERLAVFDALVPWFPARMRPPVADVVDFMPVA
ncbi:Muskelin 1, intracellular mediator containing kelch motif [Allomyces arbusculus]|nr:Muskelin 1, intracellular mediator containing kelch motif [Allomyces arbusculus]